ncbi:hypothetical protein RF11_15912 [Thelohanellus kitauei]|uniref:PAS domain-containing protein n=1 Tax=Thelohanellus kitauei TaxID=669202 RepID=A0A0C2MTT4_THEKT|nr:hypothetical protein RF11_09361 [Thelohanellus kitauei]KII65092.1 hypothetical protein RF11_15912 [Thelohanellus kitauei]
MAISKPSTFLLTITVSFKNILELSSISDNDQILANDPNEIYNLIKSFLLIMGCDGTILYVSDNFSNFTGILPVSPQIKQENIIGKSFFEFVYPADYKDLSQVITPIAAQTESKIFEKIRISTISESIKKSMTEIDFRRKSKL